MTGRETRMAALALLLAGAATGSLAQPQRWTPGWGSAQMLAGGKDADAIAASGPATIRQVVHLTAGGHSVRVRLSNVAGDQPLRIGAASLATSAGPGQMEVTAPQPLTFAGARSVTIPPGAELYADPVPVTHAPGDDLAISLFLPEPVQHRTGHPGARATTFVAKGDQTGAAALSAPQRIGGWWSLSDVELRASPQTGTVVAIGDSITDGHGVTDDSNARWPDVFARRLAAAPATRHLSVVNAGIGGKRLNFCMNFHI